VSDQAAPRVDVSVGDIHHSQLVIGDHNTIQTPEGTKVTVLQVGERPVPKLRPMPISHQAAKVEIVGREEELALIASAAAGMPVQLYAPDGAGKTSLLKCAAQQTPGPAEGVVFEPARQRSLDEVQNGLYAAFWECDIPFIPDPAQIGDYLADREALVLLDDCDLDRGDTETLLERIPRCTLVLASKARTLWSQGTVRKLDDLDSAAAVQLLGRELGRPLDPGERAAAESLVASLGGHPQSLIETAALIDGGGSFRELAEEPEAFQRRFDPEALTGSQKRILVILSTFDGAALGVDHIAALAGGPDARPTLRELERGGWVKSASPRYRSVRRLSPDRSSEDEIVAQLLGRLTVWSREAAPHAVAEEAEAIERTLELGVATKTWKVTVVLALAAQRGLLLAGAWSSCQRVLRIGLRAAGGLGDESARAYLLHQLGSQSLCLGDREEAIANLTEALRIREGLGEEKGAELTRHNLGQLGGGGPGEDPGGGSGNGPPRPRLAIGLAALAVIAGVVVAVALAGGGGTNSSNAGASTPSSHPTTTTTETTTTSGPTTQTGPTTPTPPPPGAPPTITIASPQDGASFDEETSAKAEFGCAQAEGTQLESCAATLDGAPVDKGDLLTMSAGDHTFRVIALDDDGGREVKEATYSVAAPPPPPPDEVPPKITIVSPSRQQYGQGELVEAEYSCVDNVDRSVPCKGPIEPGDPVETKSLGLHTFTVTSADSAGNPASETVEYEVIESSGKG